MLIMEIFKTGVIIYALRRFKPLGIGLKVVATKEKRRVHIFQFTFFFVDFYAIYDICRLPSVEPRVLTDNLRHFVCRFQALKGPLRASECPQWFSMEKKLCHEKSR